MSLSLLGNSLAVGLGSTLLALFAGILVALAAAASGGRWRTGILGLAIAGFALPPFLVANAWLDLTAQWRAMAVPELLDRRSLWLTSLVLASLLWPLTTFLVVGAWGKIQPEHLEADPLLRGGRLFGGLLLPAARGELSVAAAITLVLALANFTVPTLFQVRVFTEEFWIRFNTQFDTWGALRAAWPLVVIPLGLLALLRSRRVHWPRLQLMVPSHLLRQQLGVLAPLALAFTGGWLALTVGFPLGRLGFTVRTWTELPGALAAGHEALVNSVVTSAVTATLVVAAGGLLAGRGPEWRGPRASWLGFLIPGVFLGVGLITTCNRPALAGLYESLGIVLAGLFLRYLAPGWALVAHALRGADPGLAEAAHSLGATRGRVWRDVWFPQAAPGLAAAWYVVYVLSLWDVETVVLIQPPGGMTLALRIFNLLHYGHAAQVNSLCVVMLGLAVAPWVGWGILGKVKGKRQKANRGGFRWGSGCLCGAVGVGLGAFLTGCSPRPAVTSTPMDSKLFSSVEIIGARGVAPGLFNKPRSLVCDREDNLYVADLTGRIQKFGPDGRYLLQWQMPQTDLGKPKGMTLDRDGNIVVVEPHYMRVNHFTTEGKLVAQWGVKGTNLGEFILPRAIAQNSRGEFYVSEYTVLDRVQRFVFQPVGADVRKLTSGSATADRRAAVGAEDKPAGEPGSREIPVPFKWSGAGGKVESPYSGCHLTAAWGSPGTGPGEFNRAEGLALGPGEEVFVADSCNHRIQVFDRDGKFLRTHGKAGSHPGEFSYPYDVRVDAQGQQFICEFGNSRITVLDAQDRVVEVIGGPGAAPGRFANPWAIALDSKGNLYVADSQNHRVQKLVRRSVK